MTGDDKVTSSPCARKATTIAPSVKVVGEVAKAAVSFVASDDVALASTGLPVVTHPRHAEIAAIWWLPVSTTVGALSEDVARFQKTVHRV